MLHFLHEKYHFFLFSLDFAVKCDLDTVRLTHMADKQSCKNQVFCYICLLCLSSSAHLYRRTPSLPACPQHVTPSYLNGPLSLSVFSLSTANPCQFLSDTTWASYQTESEICPSYWPSHSSSQHEMRKPFYLLVWRAVFTSETDIQWEKYTRPGIYIMKVDFMNTGMSAGVCCCAYWLYSFAKMTHPWCCASLWILL